MSSGPYDEAATPLTAQERRVLAALEADFGRARARRLAWRRAVVGPLAVVVALVAVAVAVSVTVLLTTSAAVAVAVTGLVCTAAATTATALVVARR